MFDLIGKLDAVIALARQGADRAADAGRTLADAMRSLADYVEKGADQIDPTPQPAGSAAPGQDVDTRLNELETDAHDALNAVRSTPQPVGATTPGQPVGLGLAEILPLVLAIIKFLRDRRKA